MSAFWILLIILFLMIIPIGIFLLGYYTGKEIGISKKLSDLNKNKTIKKD